MKRTEKREFVLKGAYEQIQGPDKADPTICNNCYMIHILY